VAETKNTIVRFKQSELRGTRYLYLISVACQKQASVVSVTTLMSVFCLVVQMTVNVDGHSWALCSVDENRSPRILSALNKDLIPVTESPLVVQQHSVPPQKFVLLSAQV